MQVNDYSENYGLGWVKSYRSTIKKGWYKKSEYFHLWHHLLYRANHEGIEFMFAGENITLNPGQFVTGRKVLSDETGIHESKIERLLNFFENKERQIEQQKTNKYRVITILNWHLYQSSEQQLNNKRTTTEQQVNTNKNDKNDNKEKEDIYIPEWDEFKTYGISVKHDVNIEIMQAKYNAWKLDSWKDGKGKKIRNWKSKVNHSIQFWGTQKLGDPTYQTQKDRENDIKYALDDFNARKKRDPEMSKEDILTRMGWAEPYNKQPEIIEELRRRIKEL